MRAVGADIAARILRYVTRQQESDISPQGDDDVVDVDDLLLVITQWG